MNLTINTIVVPQGAEHQAVCRGIKQAQAKKIRIISIPIGTKDVLQTLVNRSFEFKSPQQVLILGLCGSLNSRHDLGDCLLYQGCYNSQGDYLDLDWELTTALKRKLMLNLIKGLTSDRPICLTQEKLKLGQKHGAEAVDMEGYAYIKELQRQGISVAMLRIVSDDVNGDIPDLSQAIDENGSLNSGQIAIAFLRQPIASFRLIRGSLSGLKQLQRMTEELFSD